MLRENDETIFLPLDIIDSHCHMRDLEQSYKTTIKQTLVEARNSLIRISVAMPNLPPISTVEALETYDEKMEHAEKELQIEEKQLLYFGLTDNNLEECEIALQHPRVVGLKDYPLSQKGKTVTTGAVGVMFRKTREEGTRLTAEYKKISARHCANPEIIAKEHGETINAVLYDVEETLDIGKSIPGAIIVICHVPSIQSAMAIMKAQKEGLNVWIELCPHYLWFDSDGTNWNPNIDPVYYHCFNNLQSREHREFLTSILGIEDCNIILGSDSAPHTKEEKVTKRLGGIPSNQELVPVICTLAKRHNISEKRIFDLLCGNASRIFSVPVSEKLIKYRLKKRIDNLEYNNGIILNPWRGSELCYLEKVEDTEK